MGKEGLRLVLLAFNNEEIKKEDAPKAAEFYLENLRFIYQDPDAVEKEVCFLSFHHNFFFSDVVICSVIPQNKGAFLNPLVSACLAVHLKKTSHNVIQYGYPVGGLAIAISVVR
jgi:hypothetical protein